jgi:DNA polymerase-3 subunit alpha
MAFVHLHNRSQYSLLDGAIAPKAVATRAAELGQSAIALTDTCNLYGAFEFWKSAKGCDVQAILGTSIWMWPPGLEHLRPDDPDTGWDILLLIEGGADGPANQTSPGYKNLCALVTKAIFEGMHYRPRIDFSLLADHSEGLICLTSGLTGPIGHALRRGGRPELAREHLSRLAGIFGEDRLFVELQDNGLPGQDRHLDLARSLSQELGLPTVVTNDCRYSNPEDAVTLDLLNCIARGEAIDGSDRDFLPTDQQYIKSEEEMRALFPDDQDALDRTVEIAARCAWKFKTAPPYFFPATDPPDADPPTPEGVALAQAPRADTQANWEYFYKAFPPPKDYGLPDPTVEACPPKPDGAGSINGYFEWYVGEGLKLRLRQLETPEERHAEYWDRLRFEMDIILNMGFPAYLLIVAEFINWAKDNEIPVGPGRGSGAGSLVNFAMRITDIDPLRFGLLMERFLNPERVSMPDIDVDFCQDRREEVITHTREKYGSPLVSQIITYGKLQAKAALKDVARVLGLDFNAADRIAKLVPNELGIKLDKALEDERLKALAEGDPLVGRVAALARRVEGMTRQTGVHAAGVVIADRPLVEHAPLYRDGPDGGPVVQYEMKAAESVGLIKFDFLGLKTLDQLRDAVKMVARNTGEHIDLAHIPLDDEPTFKLLQKGDALGVFQVESSGMRELLTRLLPSNIDDLIALLALYRPGPLSSGMVDNFIDCKHGRKAIEYPHDSLEWILKPTYGSIVYQEQVMQIAQVYSGYSLGGADLLRRAMGKKKKEEMDKQRVIFVEGAVNNGHSDEAANELFDLLAYFAGYGFNKSHSAAYGVVSYHTAYLKAHHRAEYMAALMTIEANNTDKVLAYIGDCKRAGLEVMPPDINESVHGFDVPPDKRDQIRFGLAAVKGVGSGAIEAIIEARADAGGRFADFGDCLERLDYRRVNKKVLESLIKCGAFDWTGNNRQQLLKGLPAAMSSAQRTQSDKASGQTSLFGGHTAVEAPKIRLPDVGEWPLAAKLGKEREALGFFITGHPVEAFAAIVRRVATCSIDELPLARADMEVRVAGMVSALRQIKTRRGDKMAFVTMEDVHGSVECVFFSDPWARSREVLGSDQPVLVQGKLEKGADGTPKILAESARSLAEVREQQTRAVHLVLDAEEVVARPGRIDALKALLEGSRGRCPVQVHVHRPGHSWTTLELGDARRVTPDEALLDGIESLFRRPDAVVLS